jgi:integrase/recombinase XerD
MLECICIHLLYAQHLQALKLQGKRGKTIDGYSRAMRRIAGYFNRCPNILTAADLKTYFAWMVENYSWSSVKVDLGGCGFLSTHPRPTIGLIDHRKATQLLFVA